MPNDAPPGRPRPQHRTAEYQQRRRRLLDAQRWRCAECGRAGRLELHHRIAVEHGGDDADANLIGLCRPCHFRAHDRGPGIDRTAWRVEIARRLAE